MKKILVNAYLALNFGDDLFLKILFERYPNVKWILPSDRIIYDKVFANYSNVIVYNKMRHRVLDKLGLLNINSFLNRYDAGVSIGGSIFIKGASWEKVYKKRYKLINSFYRKNKPYYILGSNFGPYDEEVFVDKYKEVFKLCKDICFRDQFSYDIFKQLKNVRINPDIVFQLKTFPVNKEMNSLGISVISLKGRNGLEKYHKSYCNKIREIIEVSMERGQKVTLFSFCEIEGDMIAIKDILNGINDKEKAQINVINYKGNIDEFLYELKKMNNIIGTRFHSVILSQVFEQGIYPIVYSEKTYNVLKDIKLDNKYSYIKDIENIDVNRVLDDLAKNKIKDKEVFIKAEAQFKELDKYVKST